MATVKKHGKCWQLIAYLGYDKTGKQIREFMTIPLKDTTKTEAQREAIKFEDALKKKHLRYDLRSFTLSEFVQYWWDNYGNSLSPSTIATYTNYLVRIEEALGHIRLKNLSVSHILQFKKAIENDGIRKDGKTGKLSSRSIELHWSTLNAILNKAVKWRIITENPCTFVDKPQSKSKKTPIFQPDTMQVFMKKLLESAPLMHRLFFLFAFTDGLRRSEVMGIDEKALDLENGYLDILTVGVLDKNHRIVYRDKTKTDGSCVRMQLSAITIACVKAYLAERHEQEHQLGITKHCTKLFTHLDGTPYNPNSFLKWVQSFARRNGLPHITVQSFRKMAVTYVLPMVNLKEASEFARHSNIQTTARAYSEVLADRRALPTKILNSIVEDAVASEKSPTLEK